MDHRWLAAMERGPLHQSFLSAECKTNWTKGRDRDRGTTPNRARRGNHLRLWAAVCGVLFGKRWLPLCSMPQTESSSSQENSPSQMDHIKVSDLSRQGCPVWVKSIHSINSSARGLPMAFLQFLFSLGPS